MDEMRFILHIDMDAFYASIEQRDTPALRNQPLAVGGRSQRGVVAAASYEARKYGVHSAMPSAKAKQLCPDLIFVRARFDVYRSISREIKNIFLNHTPWVEPLSLDEAYLDVTDQVQSLDEAAQLARQIRNEIKDATQLNASAGISFNKFLAKMASDQNKPNGQYIINPEMAREFMDTLPIRKFHGIGEATAKKMEKLGIHTGHDLGQMSDYDLSRHFGKAGMHYYNIIRGNDKRNVNPKRIRKSIGVERTFSENRVNDNQLFETLEEIIHLLRDRLAYHHRSGKTLTLKLRYSDFTTLTRSRTLTQNYDPQSLGYYARELLGENRDENRPVRLLGLTISNLNEKNKGEQLKLDF